MPRALSYAASVIVALLVSLPAGNLLADDMPPPQAPANLSWLPHGYGNSMLIDNTIFTRKKVYHGFRNAPSHIGCYGMPLWGWDDNGFYLGPNRPDIDPVMCQLPIGLIYPENSPPVPPPPPMPRKVHK